MTEEEGGGATFCFVSLFFPRLACAPKTFFRLDFFFFHSPSSTYFIHSAWIFKNYLFFSLETFLFVLWGLAIGLCVLSPSNFCRPLKSTQPKRLFLQKMQVGGEIASLQRGHFLEPSIYTFFFSFSPFAKPPFSQIKRDLAIGYWEKEGLWEETPAHRGRREQQCNGRPICWVIYSALILGNLCNYP